MRNKWLIGFVISLLFLIVGCQGKQNSMLDGSSWQLHSFGDHGPLADPGRPLDGSVITINFGVDGVVNGSAGCNGYSGRFKLIGDQLQLEELSITEMGCPSMEIMGQEVNYFRRLGEVGRAEIVGGELRLFYGSEELRYERK